MQKQQCILHIKDGKIEVGEDPWIPLPSGLDLSRGPIDLQVTKHDPWHYGRIFDRFVAKEMSVEIAEGKGDPERAVPLESKRCFLKNGWKDVYEFFGIDYRNIVNDRITIPWMNGNPFEYMINFNRLRNWVTVIYPASAKTKKVLLCEMDKGSMFISFVGVPKDE